MKDEHFPDDERDDTRRGKRVGTRGLDVSTDVESVVSGFTRKLAEECRRLQRLAAPFPDALDVSAGNFATAVHSNHDFDGPIFTLAGKREDRAEFRCAGSSDFIEIKLPPFALLQFFAELPFNRRDTLRRHLYGARAIITPCREKSSHRALGIAPDAHIRARRNRYGTHEEQGGEKLWEQFHVGDGDQLEPPAKFVIHLSDEQSAIAVAEFAMACEAERHTARHRVSQTQAGALDGAIATPDGIARIELEFRA